MVLLSRSALFPGPMTRSSWFTPLLAKTRTGHKISPDARSLGTSCAETTDLGRCTACCLGSNDLTTHGLASGLHNSQSSGGQSGRRRLSGWIRDGFVRDHVNGKNFWSETARR